MAIEWRLKQVAKERGLSLYEIAAIMKIQAPSIYRIANADPVKHINAETLAAMCRALECQPGDLLAYVPEKAEKKKR